MTSRLPYRYICIEGNIGSGKTTLAQMLAEKFGSRLMLEQFDENPFLPEFYKDRERYAFPVEIFFLSERHKQMTAELSTENLFNPVLIADYCFYKTVLFARQNLNASEFGLFYKLYVQLNHQLAKPDILIFLERPTNALLHNIARRNRLFEKLITADYLHEISAAYKDYLITIRDFPVLTYKLEDMDFMADSFVFDKIANDLLDGHFSNGLHVMSFNP